jgi:hypothetical protein
MAISVDTVYQKVLALANKEQRGYITPQEFNLFADHAQKDIFRQYFHDLDQARRRAGNDTHYADIVTSIEEKISLFEKWDQSVTATASGDVNLGLLGIYKLTRVVVSSLSTARSIEAEQVQLKNLSPLMNSSLITNVTSENKLCAYYTLTGQGDEKRMKIWPHPVIGDDSVTIDYVRELVSPNWTYVISGENALFSANTALGWKDFELHSSEENALVVKILQLAGVSIKDNNLVQITAQEEAKKIQQEKS